MIDDDDLFESESFEGPEIVIKVRNKNPGSAPGRKKATGRVYDQPKGTRTPGSIELSKAVKSRTARFRGKPGFADYRRSGTPDGMSKNKSKERWKEAREIAAEEMKKLKEIEAVETFVEVLPAKELDTDADRAEAAATVALEILHSPMNHELRLKAAALLLNYYKAKPSSKTEVTVKTAHEWLASLEDNSDDE